MTKPTGKPKGRPPLPPDEGKRNFFGLRVTDDLKRRIAGAAKAKGRSMSQEAEFRLDAPPEGRPGLGGGVGLQGCAVEVGESHVFIQSSTQTRRRVSTPNTHSPST